MSSSLDSTLRLPPQCTTQIDRYASGVERPSAPHPELCPHSARRDSISDPSHAGVHIHLAVPVPSCEEPAVLQGREPAEGWRVQVPWRQLQSVAVDIRSACEGCLHAQLRYVIVAVHDDIDGPHFISFPSAQLSLSSVYSLVGSIDREPCWGPRARCEGARCQVLCGDGTCAAISLRDLLSNAH